MTNAAHVTITGGPDEGKVYEILEELVHIGQDPESQIILTDPDVDEHQASIVRRNGRYAIYTPHDDALQVDGNGIPAEKWVWLPANAQIRLSNETTLLFHFESDTPAGEAEPPPAPVAEPPKPKPPASRKQGSAAKRKRKRAAAKKDRKVAQFITDQAGDQLVRLGEDGQLPELTLAEAGRKAAAQRGPEQKNPAVLYLALGFSLLASLAMLFYDPGSGGSTRSERATALKEIERFYGYKQSEPQPYQRYLREARRAYSIGDRKAEFAAYQNVLDLLNAEDVVNSLNGLTGDKKDDVELRRYIGILMNR